MQIRSNVTIFLSLLGLVIGAASTTGCGSEFSDAEEPQLTIAGDQGFTLNLPDDDMRPETQQAIEIRNSGGADLTVTSVQLINTPSRLQILGERGGTCSTDADCGEGICFPDTSTCAQLGAPDTPYTIAPQTRRDLELVLTRGPRELDCATAPAGTPENFTADYCGELRIETRAINSGGFVEDGNATIYFLAPSGSGQISVNPSFLEFNEVTNNYTETKSFTVSNDGQQVLTIRSIATEDRSNLFSVSPTNFPLEVAPGTSQTFDLTLAIDEGEVELNFTTDLLIDSTAASVPPFTIRVTTDAEPGPRIQVEPISLTFDAETTQDITITNVGMTTLTVNSLTVQPAAIRDFYSFEHEGAAFDGFAVPAGDSKTIQATFNRPGGNNESAIGELQIGHNDASSGNRSTVTLLGDAGNVPVGQILPTSMTFRAAVGAAEERQFVIRNIGAGPLTINAVDPNFSEGEESEYVVSGATGTIQPGEFATASVAFSADNDTPDTGEFAFDSDSQGTPLILPVVSTGSTEEVTPVITPTFQGDLSAGALATFTSTGTMPSSSSRTWVLIGRPAGSSAFSYRTNDNFSVQTDVAGTYEIAMTARAGTREVQTTATFVVTD